MATVDGGDEIHSVEQEAGLTSKYVTIRNFLEKHAIARKQMILSSIDSTDHVDMLLS